jgi:hypothetical protein
LEPPSRRDWSHNLAVLTPMDHAGQTLGALVSHGGCASAAPGDTRPSQRTTAQAVSRCIIEENIRRLQEPRCDRIQPLGLGDAKVGELQG